MKVIVLSRGPNLYSTRRIVSVARRRGHSVEVFDVNRLSMSIVDGAPRLYEDDYEVTIPDAVIPRIAAPSTFQGLSVLRHFEMAGAIPVNCADAIAKARDKLRCLQVLSGHGVPIPDTAFSRTPHSTDGALHDLGEGQVVVKLLEGTQGRGVMLAQSRAAATSILDAFGQVDGRLLAQRFVAESAGRDLRAFVVGGKVAALMERRATTGDFRSNLHQGGTARQVTLTRVVERIATRAARALGLDVAGVDLLPSAKGPLVIEVNACPGLEGIERATGINIAARIVQHMEALVGPAAATTPRRTGFPRARTRARA